MFCKFCGEKIEDNAIFCSKCGAKLTSKEKTNVVSSEISDTTTNSLNEDEKPIKKGSDKILNIMQKVVFGCLIAGIAGITLFLGIVLVGLLVVFFLSYFQNKKIFHSGEIKFDKNGILDTSDSGVRIGVDWGLVDLVVVKDKIIVLLTKTNFYFHFDEELIDKVLEAVNKYHKDVKILNVSLTRFKVDEVVKSEKIDEIKLNEPKEEVQEEIEENVTEDVKELDVEEDVTEEIDTTKIEEIKVEEKEEEEEVEDVDDVIGYVVPEEDDRVLNPIAQEVSTMENHPIIKITIPPYDESEESTEEEE